MSEKTLTELLAEVGIGHIPSVIEGKRELYNAQGGLGLFDAKEAWEYLQQFRNNNA